MAEFMSDGSAKEHITTRTESALMADGLAHFLDYLHAPCICDAHYTSLSIIAACCFYRSCIFSSSEPGRSSFLPVGLENVHFLHDSSLTGRSTIVVVFVVAAPIYTPPNSNNYCCWSEDRLEIGEVLLVLLVVVLVDCCVRSEPTEGTIRQIIESQYVRWKLWDGDMYRLSLDLTRDNFI
eukprot:scaffold1980_cov86-Skeletonema_marinoi.AAC.4